MKGRTGPGGPGWPQRMAPAFTLLNGPPGVRDFDAVDAGALARHVEVVTDPSLLESEAVLSGPGRFEARVRAARGSPERPMTTTELAHKVGDLAGDSLPDVLDDPDESAKAIVEAAHLR